MPARPAGTFSSDPNAAVNDNAYRAPVGRESAPRSALAGEGSPWHAGRLPGGDVLRRHGRIGAERL